MASRSLTYVEESTHADTYTTNQTLVTASSRWFTGIAPQENMESQNRPSPSSEIAIPSSSSEITTPFRFRFSNSQTRGCSTLRRNKSKSTVKYPNGAASISIASGNCDRDYPGQPKGHNKTAGEMQSLQLYQLVVLGDERVGKTALTQQFKMQHLATYDPTGEDQCRRSVVIDGESCVLDVLENDGEEVCPALRDQWIRNGEGFVLVYSICQRPSFTQIPGLYNLIKRVKDSAGPQIQVMLVGHEYDEDEKGNFLKSDREVSTQEGYDLAKHFGFGFIEASVKHNINIEKAFYDVAGALRRQRASGMLIISE